LKTHAPVTRKPAWLVWSLLSLGILALLTVQENHRVQAFTSRFVSPFGDDTTNSGGNPGAGMCGMAPCQDCSTPDSPCKTVQNAINQSGSGDLIDLAPGMYTENVTVNQSVTIQGDAFNPSIMNGGGIGPGFIINATDTGSNPLAATLSMMTITNGNAGDSAGNHGGGIQNNGSLTVVQSTINGNRATGTAFPTNGGGIWNSSVGTLTVINSTISGNQSHGPGFGPGGGIFNSGTTTLVNTTINGNAGELGGGGGILNSINATLNFTNTIIAGSPFVPDCNNSGTIGTNSHNLVQDGSCNPAVSGDPKLGPLQNNGGPTFTHALLPTSPAIDAGDDSVLGSPYFLTTDQRGNGFPRKVCAHVDIGAYEANSGVPPTINCPPNITKFTDPGQTTATVSFTVTASDSCGNPLTPNCSVTSPHAFPLGMTTVSCSATDSQDQTSFCSFTVTVVPLNVCIQDDHTRDTFRFNSQTGQYLYTRCSDGFTLTGTGMVSIVNGYVTITDNKPDRRINAGWSLATFTGRANVTLVRPGVFQTITVYDTNPHPTCTCS
jgi:hypothetical protein